MSDDTPKTVTVEALQHHTYEGQTYEAGDTYQIDAQYADSVEGQGKAKRVAVPAEKPRKSDKSTAVEPLTKESFMGNKG